MNRVLVRDKNTGVGQVVLLFLAKVWLNMGFMFSVSRQILLLGLALFLLLAGSGCGPQATEELGPEEQERHFVRGKQYLREGREREALRQFLLVIDLRRGLAPESHLEAGEIFLTHLRDPVEAIHHFRKYLDQKPDSRQAAQVRGRINVATREFLRTMPGQPMEGAIDRQEMLDRLERLHQENRELKERIAAVQRENEQLRARLQQADRSRADARTPPPRTEPARPGTAPTTTPSANREGVRMHTVVSGDSLYRLSQQYYGTPVHFRLIFEANRDQMPNENALRVGMQLRIPPRPEG